MSTQVQTQVKTPTIAKPSFVTAQSGLLHNRSAHRTELATHALAMPGLGHNFSQVRVHAAVPGAIQTKLTVNQPGDKYEQEADQVAEQVMRMPVTEASNPCEALGQSQNFSIQRFHPERKELHRQAEEEEEELQRQSIEEEEEEETLQAKESPGHVPTVTPELQARINPIKGGGQPLPAPLRAFMEPRFGHDFSRVRIHADTQAAGTARAVQARAYTVGRDIVFGAGQYAPETASGKRLLAHELTHVVQQGGFEKHDLGRAPLDLQTESVTRDNKSTVAHAAQGFVGSPTISSIQRAPEEKQQGQCQFSTDGAIRYTVTTGENNGNYYQFPSGVIRKNRTNRPLFENPRSAMTRYTGVGSDGEQLIHPAVAAPLNALMSALREVGSCIDDESMKRAFVASAYRPSSKREGEHYLGALETTIKQNPNIFSGLKFPKRLENMATSSLGTYGSQKHKEFVAALAKESGWGQHLAQELADITEGYKAPRGGSAHHSGLAVDINFPYPISATKAQWHGIHRERNQQALRSAAGVWLGKFASDHGFASYNTGKEIWHQEWLNWKDSSANPEQGHTPTVPKPTEEKPVAPKQQGPKATVPGEKKPVSLDIEAKAQGITTPKSTGQKVTVSIAISYGKNAHAKDVTAYSRKVLEDILRAAGLKSATISSTSRDATDQARVMFDNLEKYGVAAQKKLYMAAGREVIDAYDKAKKEGKSEQEIKAAMKAKIEEIGPTKVSRHASNPNKLNVFDVGPSSIADPAAFEHAVEAEGRVSKFLKPPKDPGYHLEIPQQ